MRAWIEEATMSDGAPFPICPLFNIYTAAGQVFTDVTAQQARQIIEREGLVPATKRKSADE